MPLERTPGTGTSLAADRERRRLAQRASSLDAVVRELRLRARLHQERRGELPAPLRHALADLMLELRSVDRRLGELPGPFGTARRPARRRFDRTPQG